MPASFFVFVAGVSGVVAGVALGSCWLVVWSGWFWAGWVGVVFV